jgi:hypothetical protein
VTVKDADLHRFQPGNYDSLQIIPASGDTPILLRLTRQRDGGLSGPAIRAAPDPGGRRRVRMEHRQIQIDIEARAAGDFAASTVRGELSREGGVRDRLEVVRPDTGVPDIHVHLRDAAARRGILAYDFIGIRPVAPDKYRTMEVRSVRVHGITAKKS